MKLKAKSKIIIFGTILLVLSVSSFVLANWFTPSNDKYKVRLPADQNSKAPVLILLHGLNGNENSLFKKAKLVPDNFLVVSPKAPIYRNFNRYSWFEVDFGKDYFNINPKDEEKSRQYLLNLIEELDQKYKIDKDKIYFAGFSQGAIMALSMGVLYPEKVAGVGVFSGHLLKETNEKLAKAKRDFTKLQVYMSHSSNDNILSYQDAQKAKAILEKYHIDIQFDTFKRGHSISKPNFEAFVKWLEKVNQ